MGAGEVARKETQPQEPQGYVNPGIQPCQAMCVEACRFSCHPDIPASTSKLPTQGPGGGSLVLLGVVMPVGTWWGRGWSRASVRCCPCDSARPLSSPFDTGPGSQVSETEREDLEESEKTQYWVERLCQTRLEQISSAENEIPEVTEISLPVAPPVSHLHGNTLWGQSPPVMRKEMSLYG